MTAIDLPAPLPKSKLQQQQVLPPTKHQCAVANAYYQRLKQRRDYLRERIKAKETMRWETDYDRSECEALSAALDVLHPL